MNKTAKNKNIGKGLVSLTTIIAVLISILAGNIYYENSITANVIKELTNSNPSISIKEVDEINDLSQLNEGWYEIRKGYVFYLEHFDYAVPLYIKVKNPEQQNGLLVVDADGTIEFDETFNGFIKEENNRLNQNQISGNVVGMEKVSGFAVVTVKPSNVILGSISKRGSQTSSTTKPRTYVVEINKDKNEYKIIIVEPSDKITNIKVYESKANINDKTKEIIDYESTTDIPKEYKITNSEALKGTILQNWDGESLKSMPIQGGSRDASGCMSSKCEFKDTYANQQGVTKTITTIIPEDGSYKKVTQEIYGGDGVKSSTETFSDTLTKTKIVINRDENNNIKSATFYDKNNKQSNIAPESFKKIQEEIPDEKISMLFLAEVSNRGITISMYNVQKDERGIIVGDPKGASVQWFGGKIASFEGSNLVGYIDTNKGESYSLLEGTAILENDNFQLLEGGTAVYIQKNEKGETTSEKIVQQTKSGKIEGYYEYLKDQDRYIVTIVTIGGTSSYTINTKPIADEKSPFYGKIEIVGPDGAKYYVNSGGAGFGVPFGISGIEIVDEYNKEVNILQLELVLSNFYKSLERAGQPTPERLSSQLFFANVERIFTEFQGLGYYATLFFDEDSLLVWRDNVDRIFATFYLGTEYWSSSICGSYLDGEDEGIAYAETPQGLAQVGAHIEATRTEPIIDEKRKRAFIYKITFNVRNGDYSKDPRAPDEMNINVVLKGEKTVKVFKEDIKIERGDSFGKMGSNAIVQDSATLFTKVCLTFDDTPLRWKLDDDELCNIIQVPSGEPTKITQEPTTTTSSTGSQGPKESEINDF